MNRQSSEELNLDAGEPKWFVKAATTGNGGGFALVKRLLASNHLNPTPLTVHVPLLACSRNRPAADSRFRAETEALSG